MPARSWLLLLCLAATAAGGGVLQARGQPDSLGFICIDCGLPGSSSYVTSDTTLSYGPDAAFTDAGENYNISADYITPQLGKIYHDVRSFPDGARNCYTLRSLTAGLKYLLRANFMYGNYDGLNRPPVFDLYIGVNFWKTVDVSDDPGARVTVEAIVVVPDSFVQVCLVNTGSGTPFISGLKLRALKSSLYSSHVNATQGLLLLLRRNFGPTNETDIVRYPDDPYDRVWKPWINATSWGTISTVKWVKNENNDEPPSKVMQTAITPLDASNKIEFSWDYESQLKEPRPGYIVNKYFAELQPLPSNAVRQFNMSLNGNLLNSRVFRPMYLVTDGRYNERPFCCYPRYTICIYDDGNSTLPPIINAVEVFSIISTTAVATDSQDASAITVIKETYRAQKDWMGDPCVPKNLAWDGLTCNDAISGPPRITRLNMSFSGLNGHISSSFANLTAVEYMNLSHNNLTGSVPDALSQLPSLTVLDLSGNQLSGSIPPGLAKRIQDGSLDLRYGDNPNLCTNESSCQKTFKGKGKALTMVIVSLVVLLFYLLRQKKKGSVNNSVNPRSEMPMSHVPTGDGYAHSSLRLENRRFTYRELDMITNNFQHVIGRGGFGYVYNGFLEDGTQVAVKLRSESSNQGVKEFLTEAQILTRIHHKNLVSMIGYCKDGDYMALVYEYMSEGSLQEHVAVKYLTWRERLRIALESAQGLEYLHNGCNPPLIHRDVKTTNILLNAKLEAKVADFGLSRAFSCDIYSHVSTNMLVGTPGYVDPKYPSTMQPTTKSDVYSFGVVLLELVTGKPAILHDPEPISVVQWARQRLAQGDIEGVVDTRMRGDHDINAVWKAADVALKCTAQALTERPTMTDVVAQLHECLELEEGRPNANATQRFHANGSGGDLNSGYNNANACAADQSGDVSRRDAAFDMVALMATGPATR